MPRLLKQQTVFPARMDVFQNRQRPSDRFCRKTDGALSGSVKTTTCLNKMWHLVQVVSSGLLSWALIGITVSWVEKPINGILTWWKTTILRNHPMVPSRDTICQKA